MKLKEFYKVDPNKWYFLDNNDVLEAKRRALADPSANETVIEEYVRQWILNELVETYSYPRDWFGERIVIEESDPDRII